MNALFDSAALAIVAYAQVDGRTGYSTCTNSGVFTTRVSKGHYFVALQTGQAQRADRNLIFVQPMTTKLGTQPAMSVVLDGLAATKEIVFGNGTSAVDTSFGILILRTTIVPPVPGSA